jgi:flagellar basal body-associated protein FliL
MNQKELSIIILTSLITASIIGIATYFWFININENNSHNDDDDTLSITKQIINQS